MDRPDGCRRSSKLADQWRGCDRKSEHWKRWSIPQTLEGSFSAVSTPIFATKYSLESSWRDLQIPHSSRDLNFQNLQKKIQIFCKKSQNFVQFFEIFFMKNRKNPWKSVSKTPTFGHSQTRIEFVATQASRDLQRRFRRRGRQADFLGLYIIKRKTNIF